ncbi:MAG TPA: hypothetical protein VKB65_05985 [Myxococcota bacterium]|nr:hypothetical protein [Myxococcota bacterium]
MGASWLRTLLIGLVLGPAPANADPVQDPVESEDSSARRIAGGQSVSGADFLVWDEDAHEAEAWAAELVHGFDGADPPSGWGAVARRTAGLPLVLTDEIAEEMAAWSEASEDDAAFAGLGHVLCLLPSLDRTYLVSSWATSPNTRLRRDLARALAIPFEAAGVRSVLDHLQHDPSEEVRVLATLAAERRGLAQA